MFLQDRFRYREMVTSMPIIITLRDMFVISHMLLQSYLTSIVLA